MIPPRAYIRSTAFNITYFIFTTFCCLILLPSLCLPRKHFLFFIALYDRALYFFERTILNLRYDVIGQEHLPEHGPYLVAAKHMSTYETFKLRALFPDPAIILKKELLNIPLWGQYLKKTGIIAIDRTTPHEAIKSITEGALRVKEEGRPLVIFPQGTRVKPSETAKDKPYKAGIHRIQNTTDLPIIPMATNSGLFWPRSGWGKTSGTITFQFLPPIMPGQSRSDLMNTLEKTIEDTSDHLMENVLAAQAARQNKSLARKTLCYILLALVIGYILFWFKAASFVKTQYIQTLSNIGVQSPTEPQISGFPGYIRLRAPKENINTPTGSASIENIDMWQVPLPFFPLHIKTGSVAVKAQTWKNTFVLDRTFAKIRHHLSDITIEEGLFYHEASTMRVTGTVDLSQTPIPKPDLTLKIKQHTDLLHSLVDKSVVNKHMGLFITAALSGFSDETGTVTIPITQKQNTIYAATIPIAKVRLGE